MKPGCGVLLATAILIPDTGWAQEKGQIGFDLVAQSFEPSASVAARFHVSSRLALRPVLTAVVRTTEEESVGDFGVEQLRTTDVDLGVSMGVRWYLGGQEKVSPYLGADAGYARTWREFTEGGRDRRIIRRGFGEITAAVIVGGHYAPSRRLGVFAEMGLGWLSGRTAYEPDDDRCYRRWGIVNSGIGLTFYLN